MIYLIILIGVFLRVYKIFDNYYFTGELGKELLYAREFIIKGTYPLTGMATSHEWLNYGPIYYWILIPIYKLFNGNPFILFWLALAISITGIWITYKVFARIVNRKFALFTALFIAMSPLWIWSTRFSKLHVFFFILIPLCIYFIYKIWQKDSTKMFWLGLTFGALFSFHFSQIPMLILFAIVFFLRIKILKIKDYLLFIVGIIIPNLTVLIYDAGNNFSMLKNLFLWIPYRILGFTHLYTKNNLTPEGADTTLGQFTEFFGRNLFWDNRLWILGAIIFLVMYFHFVFENRKKVFKDFFVFYLTFSTAIQCLALIIHTAPPVHYFMPIYLNFALLFAHNVSKNWELGSIKILTPVIFILLFVSGILSLNNEHLNDLDYVKLNVQEKTVDNILKDAGGRSFRIERIGPFDYFPENYSQNYKYLILYKGGKIDDSSKKVYIINDWENGKK